jgi:hypothetical protein
MIRKLDAETKKEQLGLNMDWILKEAEIVS